MIRFMMNIIDVVDTSCFYVMIYGIMISMCDSWERMIICCFGFIFSILWTWLIIALRYYKLGKYIKVNIIYKKRVRILIIW